MEHGANRYMKPAMYRQKLVASILSEVADATHQFRVDQEQRLQRFELRIQTLMSSKQSALADSFAEPSNSEKHQNSTESMLNIPSDVSDHRLSLRQFEYVPTESSQEVEMTRLTSSRVSSQEFGELDQMSPRFTQWFGPTVQQLARYGMPRTTARMLRGITQFVSSRSQKSCVVRLVRSRWFALAASSLIILNAMFMGVTSDWTTVRTFDAFYTLQGDEMLRIDVATPQWASIGEVCFTILFATELSLRMYVEEIAFFCGDDLALNLLDVAMVTAAIIELAASNAGIGEESIRTIRMLRMLRLLRTLRSVRILRYLRFFSKFRLLALAMQKSLVPFFWACFMLLSMLYVVGVFFLNGVAGHIASGKAHPSQVVELQSSFGSLSRCLLTLFMSITGGMDWQTALRALSHLHTVYGLVFIFFVALMTLAALNIIAGIFVNDAIEMAQMDRDIVLQTEAKKNKDTVRELSVSFAECDTDESGTITVDELTEAFNNPEVTARFRMLGVEETDAAALFHTMDTDGSEEVDIGEFVTGCLRAQSLARPVDLQTFLRESRRLGKSHQKHFKQVALKLDSWWTDVEASQTCTMPPSQGWERQNFMARSADGARQVEPPRQSLRLRCVTCGSPPQNGKINN